MDELRPDLNPSGLAYFYCGYYEFQVLKIALLASRIGLKVASVVDAVSLGTSKAIAVD